MIGLYVSSTYLDFLKYFWRSLDLMPFESHKGLRCLGEMKRETITIIRLVRACMRVCASVFTYVYTAMCKHTYEPSYIQHDYSCKFRMYGDVCSYVCVCVSYAVWEISRKPLLCPDMCIQIHTNYLVNLQKHFLSGENNKIIICALFLSV